MSGRARDGRLVHFDPAGLDIRAGDIITTTVTGSAPHHLIADGRPHTHRRTRVGDAHAAGQKPRTGAGAGRPATSSIGLGMPGIGVPAAQPASTGCTR
jgi:tRNA-2-methylthio-N6-dimethylallyladenosine synthase